MAERPTMSDWHDTWKYILASATVIGAWLYTYVLQPTCHALEHGADKLHFHPNVVAATVYLAIVLVITWITIWVLRQSHISRVMVRGWDRRAAKHVLYLMLAVVLANGTLHAVQQINLHLPTTTTPKEALTGVPFAENLSENALLWASVNFVLLLLLIAFFVVDAIRNEIFALPTDKRSRAVSYYFAHVFGAFASEDLAYMFWEHYEAKSVVGELVKWLHIWSGKSIFIGIVTASAAIWTAMWYRGKLDQTTKVMKAIVVSIAIILAAALVTLLASGGNAMPTGRVP